MAASIFGPAHYAADLVRRQVEGGTIGATVLPISAIIGIAIAGSAILFGILTMIIMHCLRSRHKRQKGPRSLDLDDNEDIIEALRSTGPSEIKLETRTPYRPSHSSADSLPKEWTKESNLYGPHLANTKLVPPPYAFQITGLRDSWPLVGWVPSPAPPLSVNQYPVISPADTIKRTSFSAFITSTDSDPAWPQRAFSRSATSDGGYNDRSIRWSSHLAKPSITSLKRLSYNRRSMSDNQLTSILRSTSQRLREAQRRPISRPISVMTQVSGAPPAVKPPSPPEDRRGESREALIEVDDASCAESVRSSVLNMVFQTPSPTKTTMRSAGSGGGCARAPSPAASGASETDSLCPSKTPDLFIPAALTSPSKRGTQTDQRYKIRISAQESPTKICGDNRAMAVSHCGSDENSERSSGDQTSIENDPFIYAAASTKSGSRSPSHIGPRPKGKRKATFGQEMISGRPESASLPLHDVSGNQKLPTRAKQTTENIPAGEQINPFQWPPQRSRSLALSPSQKPGGIKHKGHKRRRTVRLSHLPRPVSVSVVLEEPENESTPPRMQQSRAEMAAIALLSPEAPVSSSSCPVNNKIVSTRPPSTAVFRPSPSVPPNSGLPDNTRSSDGSYSDTLSFYDYYSSADVVSFNQANVPEPSKSPPPSLQNTQRTFSTDTSETARLALPPHSPLDSSKTNTSSFHHGGPLSFSPLKPAPLQSSNLNLLNLPTTAPPLVTRLNGPRPLPRPARSDSIAASVSLLRRMNSEVSTCSQDSVGTNRSVGSSTIPALRGGGLSPTKRRSVGNINYLRIGMETPSPSFSRGQIRDSEIIDNVSEHEGIATPENDENDLGLRMPTLEHSPLQLPPLKDTVSAAGQRNPLSVSPRSKIPIAQLRPPSCYSTAHQTCGSCNHALASITFEPDSKLASRGHDHCFVCTICREALGTAYIIDEKPNYKKHYHAKINDIGREDKIIGEKEEEKSKQRWSGVMGTPLKQSIRHESRMVMPSPQVQSPKSVIEWRGSLGLYDERGFLRSSPACAGHTSTIGAGAVEMGQC